MDKSTAELAPGDIVEVRRSRARTPPTAPDGRLLRYRFNLTRPARGDRVTVQSVHRPPITPNIPRYPDLLWPNGSPILQVTFTDGSVAYAPAEQCGWYAQSREQEPPRE